MDWWEVNGTTPDEGGNDVHDARHWPSLSAALNFLVGHKMRKGDTLAYAPDDSGRHRELEVEFVMHGQQIYYDVGTHEISDPEGLIRWLEGWLQPGDVVSYHHPN
jgi:hypothetical protein